MTTQEKINQKEKAQELYSKFRTKKQALICVEEILSYIEEVDPQSLCYELLGERDYWREVKSELDLL